MRYLELHPGGKLIQFKHNRETGKEDQTDVTDLAPTLLWTELRVCTDTTLNDVFLLLKEHIDFFDMVIGNHCKAYVEEAFSKYDDKDTDLVSVTLNWNFTINNNWEDGEDEFAGYDFPNLGAVGANEEKYSVSFLPVYKYKHLPLVLVSESEIFNEGKYYKNKDYKNPDKYKQSIKHTSYSLGSVLYGIIWELSFFGDPASRQVESDEITRRIKDIDSGASKTVPFDEAMKQLSSNAEDLE